MFILNPYNTTLSLSNRDNRKLFKAGCNGLDAKYTFDGKAQKYTEFVKLIEKYFKDIHVMSTLNNATTWPAVGRGRIKMKWLTYYIQAKC